MLGFAGIGLLACTAEVSPSYTRSDLRGTASDSMLLFGEVRLIGVEVRPPVGVEIVRWEGTQDEFARFIALPYSTRDDSRLGPSAMTATDGLGRYRFFRPVRKGPTYAVRVVPLIHEPFGVTYYPQLLGPHTPDTLELVLELRPRGND